METIKNLLLKIYSLTQSEFTNKTLKSDFIEVGDYTYGNPQVTNHTNKYKLKIGKFCSISTNVKILVAANHNVDWITTYPLSHKAFKIFNSDYGHPSGKGDVIIGNDVWIGRDVIIMSGVTIGNGAVIGAGAIVTRNVSDYEIVGGNPAKHIRFRFEENQIKELLKISWWDWDVDTIKNNRNLLESNSIDDFIKKYAK